MYCFVIVILFFYGSFAYTEGNERRGGGGNLTHPHKLHKDDKLGLDDGILYITKDTWLKLFVQHGKLTWPSKTECNISIGEYSKTLWTKLHSYQQDEVWFCFLQLGGLDFLHKWSTAEPQGCDRILKEYYSRDWSNLTFHDKKFISSCIHARFVTQQLKVEMGLEH